MFSVNVATCIYMSYSVSIGNACMVEGECMHALVTKSNSYFKAKKALDLHVFLL